MIERGELAAWLRLLETPGVGRASVRRLLAAFGSPEAVIAASTASRRAVVDARAAAALADAPADFDALAERTWRWLEDSAGPPRAVIPIGDPAYPNALLEAPDPPLLLHAQGRLALLNAPTAIAIVGSRNPTPQGAANARAFAVHLAAHGLTVVSGLALGIDAEAHLGALEAGAAGGGTIAVVGTGLDIVYPRRHLSLAHRIAAEALLVSEYAIGTPSMAANFPRRNRIIAGLARGTLVVEAALKSGSLITARLANEAGREVFAIPGSIHSPLARGCHALIRQGAKLVESASDVLEELELPGQRAADAGRTVRPESPNALAYADADPDADRRDPSAPGSPSTRADAGPPPLPALLIALGHDPVTLDALVTRTGRNAAELGAELLTLELEGRVARLPGQRFQRLAGA